MKKLSLVLALVLALVTFALPSAFAEEELVLYHLATDEQMAPIVEAFEAKYPDINVTAYRSTAEEMSATMSMELMAENPQFDVFVGNASVAIPIMNTYDPFVEWVPEEIAAIPESLLDGTGILYPIGTGFYVIIYNTNLVAAEDAPKTFLELADEKYANALVMADPSSSGSIYYYLWFITQYMGETEGYGWDYFSKLAANNVNLVASHGTLGEIVSMGERSVGIQVVSTAMTGYKRGDPIAVVFPEEGCPSEINVCAISRKSEVPDAASKFANFLLSQEGQLLIGNNAWSPVRADIEGFAYPDGTALSDVTMIGSDVAWIIENKADVLEQFKAVTE